MDLAKYPPSGQLGRVAEIMRLLFANAGAGLTSTELARGAKVSASYATQQLGQLANVGWAEEIAETGRWRPGIRIAQSAIAFLAHVDQSAAQLSEYKQRVTRTHR